MPAAGGCSRASTGISASMSPGRSSSPSMIPDVLGIGRRALESRFVRRVGHTPHEEIVRVQFRRVEQLLAATDLPLATIAARTGFRHPEYMTVAFTRRHGMSPSRWRRAHAV